MRQAPLAGIHLVQRPLWPAALETLLLRELLVLFETGRGELLIDAAWVSNVKLKEISPSRLVSLGLPAKPEINLSDYLRTFLRLGGAVRLMFRDNPKEPVAAESSRELARTLQGAEWGSESRPEWRVDGAALQIRTHERDHRKRLLGLRSGYFGSANLTANGLFNDRDDTFICWGEDNLRPFVHQFMSDWDESWEWREPHKT